MSNERMGTDPHDLNLLAAHVEGRLNAREQAAVLAHAASCFECRRVLATLAREPRADAMPTRPDHPPHWALTRARVLLPIAATLTVATVALLLVLRTDDAASPATSEAPQAVEIPAAPPVPPPDLPLGSTPQGGRPAAGGSRNPRTSGSPPEVDPGLLLRRSGERRVGSKTFELAAGEWIDRDYEPIAGLPVVEVGTRDAREGLLVRVPALRPYSALGPRVTVVHDGTVYRFSASGDR